MKPVPISCFCRWPNFPNAPMLLFPSFILVSCSFSTYCRVAIFRCTWAPLKRHQCLKDRYDVNVYFLALKLFKAIHWRGFDAQFAQVRWPWYIDDYAICQWCRYLSHRQLGLRLEYEVGQSNYQGVSVLCLCVRVCVFCDTNCFSEGTACFQVNMSNVVRGAQALFPPRKTVLEEYHRRGYLDCLKFLKINDYYEAVLGSEV